MITLKGWRGGITEAAGGNFDVGDRGPVVVWRAFGTDDFASAVLTVNAKDGAGGLTEWTVQLPALPEKIFVAPAPSSAG